MIYGYARVSTNLQMDNTSIEAQSDVIKEKAKTLDQYSEGKEPKIYDEVITGSSHPLEREKFRELYDSLTDKDVLIVAKLDRLARDLFITQDVMNKIQEKGAKLLTMDLPFLNEVIDKATSKLVLQIFGAFAEFERSRIVERMQEGRRIASQRAKDKNERSPFGRPKVYDQSTLSHAVSLLKTMSYSQVVERTGISKSTLIREVRRLRDLEAYRNGAIK